MSEFNIVSNDSKGLIDFWELKSLNYNLEKTFVQSHVKEVEENATFKLKESVDISKCYD